MENFIKTYKELCEKYSDEDLDINAKDIFELQNWIIKFENISKKDYSEYFDYNLDNFLENYHEEIEKKDILLHLLETVKNSILYIMNNMKTKIIREDIMIPASKVKEINSKGIMWLSRKPGDTIRKKLANTRNMLSIKRRLSIDTGENRLFVEFLKQIKYYLELRLDNLPKELTEDLFTELYIIIDNFLKNDELEEVKRWANLPPNNTLLSDQNYRKIWNAWNELRDLDMDIRKYSEESEACKRIDIVDNLKKILKARGNNYIFPQLPFNVNIKEYKIEPKTSIVAISPKNKLIDIEDIKNTDLKEKYKEEKKEILINEKIISTDLFAIKPICINENDKILNFNNKILFQKFFDNNFVSCEKSEAIFFSEDTQIFSFSKTLNENDKTKENLRMITKIIERNIKSKILNTTFPDILDPFQVSTLSKKLRLSYKKVRILPRSIASVYALDDNEIFKNEYKNNENILIFDIINKKITFTLLKGKEEENYSNFIWERHWTNKKEIDSSFFEKLEEILKIDNSILEELYNLGEIEDLIDGFKNLKFILNKNKILEITPEMANSIKNNKIDITEIVDKIFENNQEINKENLHIITLKNNMKIDESYCKTLNNLSLKELVIGCSRYHRILSELNKEKKGEVILWRDYLPYLGIKKMYGRFDLIKTKEAISPMYNQRQSIPIEGYITLTKGKDKHKFTLVGEDQNEKIIYEAVVKHRNPLKEDTECKLELWYTYGSDEPYEMYFIPIKSKEFSRVKVSWEERKEYEYMNLKYPQFPDKEDWDSPEIIAEIAEEKELFRSITNIMFINTKNIDVVNKSLAFIKLKDEDIRSELILPYKKFDSDFQLLNDETNRIFIELNSKNIWRSNFNTLLKDEYITIICRNSRVKNQILEINNLRENWKKDKNDLYYTKSSAFVGNNKEEVDLFIHQKSFLFWEDCSYFTDQIELELVYKEGKYNCKNIKDRSKNYQHYYAEKIVKGTNLFYDKYLIALLYKLFRDGKSVYDLRCSEDFRKYFLNVKRTLLDNFEKFENKDYLFFIISLISKDFEIEYYNIAKEFLENTPDNFDITNIGYGLGDFSNSYQKEIYENIEHNKKIRFLQKLEILSKAVWRDRNFIFNFNRDKILFYFFKTIQLDKYIVENKEKLEDKNLKKILLFSLEYIYSVFRLREFYNNDEEFLRKLSLNNQDIRELYQFLENLIDLNIKLNSKLKFKDINKKGNNNIPDLLYAILVCINGSDEEDIKISEISNDGDENE